MNSFDAIDKNIINLTFKFRYGYFIQYVIDLEFDAWNEPEKITGENSLLSDWLRVLFSKHQNHYIFVALSFDFF